MKLDAGNDSIVLIGHDRMVKSLVILPDGRSLVSASEDMTIIIWNTVTWSAEKVLTGHSKSVNCLAVLKDETLASGSDDETILGYKVRYTN